MRRRRRASIISPLGANSSPSSSSLSPPHARCLVLSSRLVNTEATKAGISGWFGTLTMGWLATPWGSPTCTTIPPLSTVCRNLLADLHNNGHAPANSKLAGRSRSNCVLASPRSNPSLPSFLPSILPSSARRDPRFSAIHPHISDIWGTNLGTKGAWGARKSIQVPRRSEIGRKCNMESDNLHYFLMAGCVLCHFLSLSFFIRTQ